MFTALNTAITLEVGFQVFNNPMFVEGPVAEKARKSFWCNEVKELRDNSDFTTEAEYRLITAEFVVEAVKIKVDAYFRSLRVKAGWTLHYTNGAKPYHCKTDYKVGHAAKAAAAKLNARQGGGYTASPNHEYIAGVRGRIVINMMSRLPVMETTGTNYSTSVASEAYWSA